MEVLEILKALGIDSEKHSVTVTQFQSAEDGSGYGVWKVEQAEKTWVLKQAKGKELEIYSAFFSKDISGAPRFYRSAKVDGVDYFLMEYVRGEDLCNCDREKLTAALDALMNLQAYYWGNRELAQTGMSFEASLVGRRGRMEYLKDAQLEQAYAGFLELYEVLPRTLCHDDLLPFNVVVAEGKATIIDWEYAGILPYPTSLARLIAHCEAEENAFFYMTEEDKAFAIDYYYENLVKGMGISYGDYRKALDACLLYEYCEWIMLGNRYADADMDRYHAYLQKARRHIGVK